MILFIFILFHFESIQKFVSKEASAYLSKELKTVVKLEKIYLSPQGYVLIKNAYIEDLHQDTLIYAESIETTIQIKEIINNEIILDKLSLNYAHYEFKKYAGEEGHNLDFITDYFSSSSSNSDTKNPIIKVDNLEITNSNFIYEDQRSKVEFNSKINFNDMRLSNIALSISDFNFKNNEFQGQINHIRTKEKSGFEIKEFRGMILLSENKTKLSNLDFETNDSKISSDTLVFEYNHYLNFNDFEDSVNIFTKINHSTLNLHDLSYFSSFFNGIDRKITFNGDFKGIIQDFKFSNFNLSLSESSKFNGNLVFKDIINPNNTFFDASIIHCSFTREDLLKIPIPPFIENQRLSLPSNLNNLQFALISGHLKGMYLNLKGDLEIQSNLGETILKNASYQKIKNDNYLESEIITSNLDLKSIIGNDLPYNVNSHLETKLKWNEKKDISLDLAGDIESLNYMNYNYQNIKVNGGLANQFFSGKLSVNDENLKLDFDGDIDFSKEIPIMKFEADIKTAYLSKLHLFNDQKERIICGDIAIDGEGRNINDFIGFIVFNDISYYQEGQEYELSYADIVISPKDSGRIISIGSEIMNASIDGIFDIEKIPLTFDYIVSKSLPALYENKRDSIILENQNFTYSLDVSNFKPIQDLFVPDLYLSSNTFLSGSFNSKKELFLLNYTSDSTFIYGRILKNALLTMTKDSNGLTINGSIEKTRLDYKLDLENIVLDILINENFVKPSISWAAKDSSNWAKIQADGYWFSATYFEFNFLPSILYINNQEWTLKEFASLTIDSSYISLNDMEAFNSNNEKISLSGHISENPEDLLNIYVENFDLLNLNNLIEGDVEYKGKIFSNICMHDLYKNIIFESDININNFTINNELIGDIQSLATWDKTKEEIALSGKFIKENIPTFTFNGVYFPNRKTNSLDLECTMNETPLTFLNSYLNDKGISDISGFLSGKVNIKGEPNKPLLDGNLNFEYTGLKVDYLNTYYDFSGNFIVGNDEIYTSGIVELRDMLDNVSLLTGALYHTNFSDFNYNISIDIPKIGYTDGINRKPYFFPEAKRGNDTLTFKNKFFCLNTNKYQNDLFYGEAYATGQLDISGYNGKTIIEVNAKTEKGTNFVLPLSGSEEFEMEDFVVFISKDSSKNTTEDKNNLKDLILILNIEATADAQAEIVFDEVYGDKMQGIGTGNLSMKLDEFGEFTMNGNYDIIKGDYLFTLSLLRFENIVNKKFKVENGSSITWYGDPYNPEIDLKTYYPTKAATYELISASAINDASSYKKRTDVNVRMNLTQNLLTPEIKFGIEIPRADENVKSALSSVLANEQDLNRQVFSLLLLNSFLPNTNNTEATANTNIIGSTASELLSNQLSNWLSKISDDINIGLNYRAGDNSADNELALALSTEILNDRLVISGNIGNSTNSTQATRTNALIGDVNVEYKLNEDGSFRVRAFARTNDFDNFNNQQGTGTTQGLGIFYKREFDKIKIPFF